MYFNFVGTNYTIKEIIENGVVKDVNVQENEVKGFRCGANNTTCDQLHDKSSLHLCIHSATLFGSKIKSIEKFLDENNSMQHHPSLVEVINSNGHGCYERVVNIRTLTEQDFFMFSGGSNTVKDDAFVIVIPSGSIIFCITGPPRCYTQNVVLGSATKYIINTTVPAPTSCVPESTSMFIGELPTTQ